MSVFVCPVEGHDTTRRGVSPLVWWSFARLLKRQPQLRPSSPAQQRAIDANRVSTVTNRQRLNAVQKAGVISARENRNNDNGNHSASSNKNHDQKKKQKPKKDKKSKQHHKKPH